MRESTMATINRTVAENTLCWCEGRISRSQRRAAVTLSASASVKFAIKWRFYTQKLVQLVGSDGSRLPRVTGMELKDSAAACKKVNFDSEAQAAHNPSRADRSRSRFFF